MKRTEVDTWRCGASITAKSIPVNCVRSAVLYLPYKSYDLSAEQVQEFAAWVAERDELARQTASLSQQQTRKW